MKADVTYNDFIGTAAADISDSLGSKYGDNLEGFGKYFNIDETRFEVIGISIYGTDSFSISLLCIDNAKSTTEKEHITKILIEIEDEKEVLDFLFKRLQIVLYSKFDKKYSQMKIDEEVNYRDYHDSEKED